MNNEDENNVTFMDKPVKVTQKYGVFIAIGIIFITFLLFKVIGVNTINGMDQVKSCQTDIDCIGTSFVNNRNIIDQCNDMLEEIVGMPFKGARTWRLSRFFPLNGEQHVKLYNNFDIGPNKYKCMIDVRGKVKGVFLHNRW